MWRRRDFNLHPCDSEACARSTTLNCKFTFPLPYFPLPANPSLLLLQFSPIWVENISSHSSIYEVTLTSFWFIPCPSNRASNPVNSPYMSPTCPFSPWLPKQPSSLPPPTNLHIMAKIIFLNHDFLSLPLLRTCDRPQLSRGWSLNFLAKHSRPCTVHSEPISQPVPQHSPESIPKPATLHVLSSLSLQLLPPFCQKTFPTTHARSIWSIPLPPPPRCLLSLPLHLC